ncbi:hypothetical protein [Lentisalinibacter sediminis]|uniref:hypothetical protein n=1 Tax=Lentisalinibacter sediminis TaxID=2992237 RepID=UPI00386D8641
MKSLLFLTDLDQPALARVLPGVQGAGAPRAPDAANAVARWLGITPPAPPACLRLDGERSRTGPDSAVSGTRPGGSWLACMDPVSMAADMRELHMLEHAPVLADGEAAALRDDALPSLAERGFSLGVGGAGRWYVGSERQYEFTAASPAVARSGRIRDELPEGPDAGLFRALGNEIQMLWHDHPVNRARAERGLPPVNSVWFWGGGLAAAAPAAGGQRLPPLYADDPLLTGLWHRLGGETAAPPAGDAAARALAAGSVLALAGEALARPAVVKALRRGRVRIVTRDGLAATLPRRGPRALLAAWRRR